MSLRANDESPQTSSPRTSLDDTSRIAQLEHDLATTRGEKDALGNQYRSLLAKLSGMRQSLGDKLREDAVSPAAFDLYQTMHN